MTPTTHVRFTATDGILLAGLLYQPEKKTNKVAILLHGNGSGSVFEAVEDNASYAKALANHNIAFLAFNNRGAGLVRSLKRITNGEEERFKGGTTYELIKDCIQDIDGAVAFLEKQGYSEFYLIGESTGANKICVYDFYKAPAQNKIAKYVLASGGDDTGIYFEMMGRKLFEDFLHEAPNHIKQGKGEELIPKKYGDYLMSWQSMYDTINPNGDYNIFPYNEYFNKLDLSDKKKFREFEHITKPLMVIYGEHDEYCYGRVPEIVDLLDKLHKSRDYISCIIENTGHDFTGKMDEAAEKMASWLAE